MGSDLLDVNQYYIFSCLQSRWHSNKIYLQPKVTLHFEIQNLSLLFLILTKFNIAMSFSYPP